MWLRAHSVCIEAARGFRRLVTSAAALPRCAMTAAVCPACPLDRLSQSLGASEAAAACCLPQGEATRTTVVLIPTSCERGAFGVAARLALGERCARGVSGARFARAARPPRVELRAMCGIAEGIVA
jgi:hypothetical protein